MPKESHKAMKGESIAVRTSSLVPSGWPTVCVTSRWTNWCKSYQSISIKMRNNYDAETITECDRG